MERGEEEEEEEEVEEEEEGPEGRASTDTQSTRRGFCGGRKERPVREKLGVNGVKRGVCIDCWPCFFHRFSLLCFFRRSPQL
jgi:hypothetical protein